MCAQCLNRFPANESELAEAEDEETSQVLKNESLLLKKFDVIEAMLTDLTWETSSNTIQSRLASFSRKLGQFISRDLYKDGQIISKHHKELSNLKDLDVCSWTNERNKLLVEFFRGCTGIYEDEESVKKIMHWRILLSRCIIQKI